MDKKCEGNLLSQGDVLYECMAWYSGGRNNSNDIGRIWARPISRRDLPSLPIFRRCWSRPAFQLDYKCFSWTFTQQAESFTFSGNDLSVGESRQDQKHDLATKAKQRKLHSISAVIAQRLRCRGTTMVL